jgi:hypothetical protein
MPDVEERAHGYSFLFAQHKKNRAFSLLIHLVILLVAILSQIVNFEIGSRELKYEIQTTVF